MFLFRLSRLISFLALKKNLKKSLLILNFGIFLSIFASTSAIISLFIENKINSYEFELISYSEIKRYVEKSNTQIPTLQSQLDQFFLTEDINHDYSSFIKHTKFGNKIISKEDMYIPMLHDADEIDDFRDMLNVEEINYLKEYLNVFTDDKKIYYKKLFNDLEVFKNVIPDKDLKKYNQILFSSSYKDLTVEISNKENHHIYSGKLYEQWLEIQEQINFVRELLNMVEELSTVIIFTYDEYIKELNDKIIYQSNIEKNIILIAFILQLIVFVIIQFFEISSVNYEIKQVNKKKVLNEKR